MRSGQTEEAIAGRPAADVAELAQGTAPLIRRPRPADGLDLARTTFLSGERVEVAVIASRLDVSQATLYRWFGSRERMIEQVLDGIAREFLAATKEQSRGHGDERVLDFARRLMSVTVTLDPVRAFVEREPQLALRLLLGERGVIRSTLRDALAKIVFETRDAAAARALDDDLDLLVEVAVALEWATFAIGDEPQIDHAIQIMRLILESHSDRRA